MTARQIIEAEDPKDFLRNVAPRRFVLVASDFCDKDDWLSVLWALGVMPEPLNMHEAPPELWHMQVAIKVGGDQCYLRPDLMRDWPGLMQRLREPEDLDQLPVELDR